MKLKEISRGIGWIPTTKGKDFLDISFSQDLFSRPIAFTIGHSKNWLQFCLKQATSAI